MIYKMPIIMPESLQEPTLDLEDVTSKKLQPESIPLILGTLNCRPLDRMGGCSARPFAIRERRSTCKFEWALIGCFDKFSHVAPHPDLSFLFRGIVADNNGQQPDSDAIHCRDAAVPSIERAEANFLGKAPPLVAKPLRYPSIFPALVSTLGTH